jgi:WD40 repeat protein
MFGSMISKSTPHLYLSAVPFTPVNSIIYIKYAAKLPKSVKVASGQITFWPRCQNILHGHTDYVSSVAFSPDGKYIISGSYDKMVCIWNAETGEAVAMPLAEHTNAVSSVAVSPDSKYIISGSWDKQSKSGMHRQAKP